MSFLSNLFSSDTVKFIGHHVMEGVMKATGTTKTTVAPRSVQCVRLTKDHDCVLDLVTMWANLRINKLQQSGMGAEAIKGIQKVDARFLNALAYALAVQKDKTPEYEAWLFFHDDVESTDFFELQHCARGSKVTKASFVLHATC